MEGVVKAAEVLAAPQPGVEDACPEEGSPSQAASVPTIQALLDPMEDLSHKLDDILKTYGTADTAVNQQVAVCLSVQIVCTVCLSVYVSVCQAYLSVSMGRPLWLFIIHR